MNLFKKLINLLNEPNSPPFEITLTDAQKEKIGREWLKAYTLSKIKDIVEKAFQNTAKALAHPELKQEVWDVATISFKGRTEIDILFEDDCFDRQDKYYNRFAVPSGISYFTLDELTELTELVMSYYVINKNIIDKARKQKNNGFPHDSVIERVFSDTFNFDFRINLNGQNKFLDVQFHIDRHVVF